MTSQINYNYPLVVKNISEIRKIVTTKKQTTNKVGLVPTMGFLHAGHISLVEHSIRENDLTVVSIFVNPTQFGVNEDFSTYPRNLDGDLQLLTNKADVVFCPEINEIYKKDHATTVDVSKYTEGFCGSNRTGHFIGVATIVSKLFNIIMPDNAYFGEKDRQQLLVIKKLVADLDYPINVVGCPTVREYDGLAMSSRNIKLNSEERSQASVINEALQLAIQAYKQGLKDSQALIDVAKKHIDSQQLANIEYVEIRNINTWQIDRNLDNINQYVIAAAVKFGNTRLIDNFIF